MQGQSVLGEIPESVRQRQTDRLVGRETAVRLPSCKQDVVMGWRSLSGIKDSLPRSVYPPPGPAGQPIGGAKRQRDEGQSDPAGV